MRDKIPARSCRGALNPASTTVWGLVRLCGASLCPSPTLDGCVAQHIILGVSTGLNRDIWVQVRDEIPAHSCRGALNPASTAVWGLVRLRGASLCPSPVLDGCVAHHTILSDQMTHNLRSEHILSLNTCQLLLWSLEPCRHSGPSPNPAYLCRPLPLARFGWLRYSSHHSQ